jgi:hypothetical protein
MGTLKAVVRGGRAVLVQDRVDYPEGTELDLDVHEPVEELDDKELAELDASLEESRQDEQAGRVRPAEELIAELRASR